MRRTLLWTGVVLLGFIALIAAGGAWVLNSNGGTNWALARARAFTNDALQVERAEGTLAGPLVLTNVRYRDPKAGIDAAIEHARLDVSIRDLLRMTAHVVVADIRGVDVKLSEPTQPPPPEDDKPFTLEAPIDIVVDAFDVRSVTVSRDDAVLVTVDAASFVGQWIDSNVVVRRLDVNSPQGEVHFAADVRQREYYEGEGRGNFRWQMGERTIAGTLTANGTGGATKLDVDLNAPVDARLAAELQQDRTWPWKFSLDAPTFDPREELLPDSSLTSLAAQLKGAGTLQEGIVDGVVNINGEPIRVERLHFAQQPDALDLDALVHLGGGRVNASGLVRTKETPVSADLRLMWRDVVVPAALAGQELFTRGDLNVNGSAEAYRANGTMKLGPQERIADLELNVQGSPERIHLQQFDIVQQQGRFDVTGLIDLVPNIKWSLRAQANAFDPGAFAAQWPGRLSFDLESDGSLAEGSPEGTLVLTNLRGRLRNRDIGGRADLRLASNKTLTGDLDMTSGRSRVQLTAQRGNKLDAVANINVPALDDWLPNSGGSLKGRIAVQGLWPDWHVSGELDGDALQYTTMRAQAIEARWDVDRPLEPSGNFTLEVAQLVAGGFEFATVRTTAEGNMQQHNVRFDATGEPLAASFALDGSSRDKTWSGVLERMKIDVKDAAELTLRDPVQIEYSPQRASFTQACWEGTVKRTVQGTVPGRGLSPISSSSEENKAPGTVPSLGQSPELCVQGSREATGAMQANYSIANLPLSLANAVMPPSVPLVFEGAIEGQGDIAASADGTLRGRADIRSDKGRISRQAEAAADAPEVLLTYDDLSLIADLSGTDANARLNAKLDESGTLQGRLAARGLTQASANLDGAIDMTLPSLRVIEVFAPQLANVQGRAQLHAGVQGTLDAPQLSGEFRATNLATDVPEIGLKLKDGMLSIAPTSKDSFRIAGNITSGQGKMDISGDATTAGIVHMKLSGKRFQAADIPAASVEIDPQLEFSRVPERMTVTGTVHVPSAHIDLQKLPKNERTQGASSDVVVIDAKTQEEAQTEALPLFADVKVTLSDQVELVGYGLDAKVTGELDVKEQPGAATSGSGVVSIAGTYKAYGQDLEIRQGQLMFAGTPLDNPRLNFVAVRVIEDADVIAGLKVTGSAQSPELTVFSEPAMSQSDALAYVVTGKPLSDVGEGEGEGDMLQAAARSLGTAGGGVLAKSIGKRLGVDELGIKDSEALGGAALTIGQYLSPRLFVSYGVGVFEPGKVLTLRYKLSKELAFEALNSTKDSQAGIEYRMER